VSPEEILASQEQANQDHHQLLVVLNDHLTRSGWSDIEEIPAAIDLRGPSPDDAKVIFEAKTLTADNEPSQCRAAVA
jgi:hypothetical protein